MRWDSSDRALASLVAVFSVVYATLFAMAGELLQWVDGGRVLPRSHLAADVVIFTLATLGLVTLGARRAMPHWRAARRVTMGAAQRPLALPPELRRSAARLSLADRVLLTGDDTPAAFTVGVMQPRVIVSRGLLQLTSERELTAILAHEAYHVRRRDPARRLVATVLCHALLRLPIAVQLRDRVVAATEFEADRRAVQRSGRGPVAAALYRLVAEGEPREPSLAAPMAGPELLAARVTQLETGSTPVVHIATRPWLHTLVGLTLLVIAIDLVLHALGHEGQGPLWGPAHGLAHATPLWGMWVVDRLLHRAR